MKAAAAEGEKGTTKVELATASTAALPASTCGVFGVGSPPSQGGGVALSALHWFSVVEVYPWVLRWDTKNWWDATVASETCVLDTMFFDRCCYLLFFFDMPVNVCKCLTMVEYYNASSWPVPSYIICVAKTENGR